VYEGNLNGAFGTAIRGAKVYMYYKRSNTQSKISDIQFTFNKYERTKNTPLKTILPVANNDNKNQGAGADFVGGMAAIGDALKLDDWLYKIIPIGQAVRQFVTYPTRLVLRRQFSFSRPHFSAVSKLGYNKNGVHASAYVKSEDGEVIYFSEPLDLLPDTDNDFRKSYNAAMVMLMTKINKTPNANVKVDFTPKCKWCVPQPVSLAVSLAKSLYTYEGCRHACMNLWHIMHKTNKIPDITQDAGKKELMMFP